MGRKIFITSEMSIDERLIVVAEQDPQAALLWPWFLTIFDDWGRAEANTRRLKALVFPSNNLITTEIIENALQLYGDNGLIELYQVNGKPYMAIDHDKWFKYQTHIRKEKRVKDESKYPAPPSYDQRVDARTCAKERVDVDESQPTPTPSPTPTLTKDDDVDDRTREQIPAKVWEQETGSPLSPITIQKINAYMTDDGLEADVVIEAMKKAVIHGVVKLDYVDGIIKNWIKAGGKTLADITRIDAEYEQLQKRKQPAPNARSPGPEYEDLSQRWREGGARPDG